MASSAIVAGVGIAVIGFAGRYILKSMPAISKRMTETLKTLPLQGEGSKYHKGGFEPTMTKREASLILAVSPNASKAKVREQFRKIISVNHPDRSGSPYIAAKISEAKDMLDK